MKKSPEQATNDQLAYRIKELERKLATAIRASEKRALAERERWMIAISPEVQPIQDRILERLPK